MSTTEKWRTVEGFRSLEVSNLGNARNYFSQKDLSPQQIYSGYYIIRPRSDKFPPGAPESKGVSPSKLYPSVLLHRVVAELFVPNPHPDFFTDVHHINGDKSDNRAENLEWVPSHSYGNGRSASASSDKESVTRSALHKIKTYCNRRIPADYNAVKDDTYTEFLKKLEVFLKTWDKPVVELR